MFETRRGPDGQLMFRATGGGSDIPDDPSLYHSKDEWDALIAETKAIAANPGQQFERTGRRAFEKLNGRLPRPAPLAGGTQVHAGDLTAPQAGGADATALAGLDHNAIWAKYNRAGAK